MDVELRKTFGGCMIKECDVGGREYGGTLFDLDVLDQNLGGGQEC